VLLAGRELQECRTAKQLKKNCRRGEAVGKAAGGFMQGGVRLFFPCTSVRPQKDKLSVFPRLFFVLSHFRVFSSDGSSKALQNTLPKNRVEKFLQKKMTKSPNFGAFFWGAFLGEGG
jgi:hypothetical protein